MGIVLRGKKCSSFRGTIPVFQLSARLPLAPTSYLAFNQPKEHSNTQANYTPRSTKTFAQFGI